MKKEIKYPKEIWTVGHSKHPINEFISILKSFKIKLVADVRRIPYSRRVPQYNKELLEQSLIKNNFQYIHLPEIGGKRDPVPGSKNIALRSRILQGFADYMETNDFREGIQTLCELANEKRTVYMCAEMDWRKCHRSLISDYLKSHGVIVNHITGINESDVHPYTYAAKVVQEELKYE